MDGLSLVEHGVIERTLARRQRQRVDHAGLDGAGNGVLNRQSGAMLRCESQAAIPTPRKSRRHAGPDART